MTPDTATRLKALLKRCQDNPVRFHDMILRRPPLWWGQVAIARSVVKYRITVAYTGNAVGKDYLVGTLVPWWIYTRRNSLCIVTGPSQTLLGSVTWKEIRRAIQGSDILRGLGCTISSGIKTSPQVVTLAPGWGALGFSTTSIERASGQHAGELLAIGEEASGIEEEIHESIDSWGFTRELLIGNPIRPDGRFVRLIRQAEKDRRDGIPPHLAVNAIQIPSTASPHAHLEKSPVGLASRTFIEDAYRRYGRKSLWVASHIDAKIPEVSAECLIPEAWLDWAAACVRPACGRGHPVELTRRISCDLGEGVGRDSSCILVRDDLGVLEAVIGAGIGLPEAAGHMARLGLKWGIPAARMSYDKLGIGRGMPNHLARHGLAEARPYAGSADPMDRTSFTNLRTEAAWKLRNRLDPQHVPDTRLPYTTQQPFSIPPAEWWPRLRAELIPLTYSLAGKQTRLLPKDEWALILGHSPDIADALIQSFAF